MARASVHRIITGVGLVAALLAGSLVGATAMTVLGAAPAAALTTVELTSVGPGSEPPDGYSFLQDTSADGSTVFLSHALSFIGGAGTNWARVYLRSGSTTTAITPSTGYSIQRAAISDNGRYVTYVQTYGAPPTIYVYDTVSQTTEAAFSSGSAQPQDVASTWLDISDDGRYLVFDALAGLDPADANGFRDIYRHDLQTATTEWISRNLDGTPSDGDSMRPRMTPDSSSVAFTSLATNLVDDDVNGTRDAFLWHAATQSDAATLALVSSTADGTRLSYDIGQAVDVTDDGRHVVFDTYDGLLSPVQWWYAVILKDTVTGATEVVSHADGQFDAVSSRWASISGDGTTVAYESDWTHVTTGQQGVYGDVVVKDRIAGIIELVSVSPTGDQADLQAQHPEVNDDGSVVAYESYATNLVVGVPGFPNASAPLNVYRTFRNTPDTTPPQATIAAPLDGATYPAAGAAVPADYTCTDDVALAPVDPCVGTVANGTPIDTATIGDHTFTVTATDAVGLTATTSASYTVSTTLAAGLALDGSFTAIPSGYVVSVADAGDDGVTISVAGSGTAKVSMSVCGGFIVRITPGSTVTLVCGSVVATVAAGSVEVELPTSTGPVVMTVIAGGSATLTDNGSVVVPPTGDPGAPVTVTVAGSTQVVSPGSTTGFRLVGFRPPVDTGGVWNTVKGGSTVPIRFQVFYGTSEIQDLATVESLGATAVSCPTNATFDTIEELATSSTSEIRYTGESFVANWKTPRQTGMCLSLTVTTASGSTLNALFKLR